MGLHDILAVDAGQDVRREDDRVVAEEVEVNAWDADQLEVAQKHLHELQDLPEIWNLLPNYQQ